MVSTSQLFFLAIWPFCQHSKPFLKASPNESILEKLQNTTPRPIEPPNFPLQRGQPQASSVLLGKGTERVEAGLSTLPPGGQAWPRWQPSH